MTTTYSIRHDGLELRLAPGCTLRVGRHPSNDVVLDDPTVSRFHARVRWPVGRRAPLVEDLGSANGTVVDGVRARGPVTLDERAAIRVGDVLLEAELDDPALIAEDSTLVCRLYSDVGEDGLDGPLDEHRTLADLLLDLERTRCTGTLRLRAEDGGATLTFAGGRVVDAAASVHAGMPALRHALTRFRRGWFSFRADIEPHECSLDVSPRELLAGGVRLTERLDRAALVARRGGEARRGSA